MIFGDLGGLKLYEICLRGEGKPGKNLTQETCPDWGSNPRPLRDRRACYPCTTAVDCTIRDTWRISIGDIKTILWQLVSEAKSTLSVVFGILQCLTWNPFGIELRQIVRKYAILLEFGIVFNGPWDIDVRFVFKQEVHTVNICKDNTSESEFNRQTFKAFQVSLLSILM